MILLILCVLWSEDTVTDDCVFLWLMHSMYFVATLTVFSVKIAKFDTESKEMVFWTEENCWPSEPVFVPRPNGESEDDGKDAVQPHHIIITCEETVFLLWWTLLFLNSFYRCGLVISDQHQPGPVMLPPGPGRQNVQRSGSSIRWCQVAEGHAWIFHPTCIKPLSPKASHSFWWCFYPTFLLWFIDSAWIMQLKCPCDVIPITVFCFNTDVITPQWKFLISVTMFYHQLLVL